MATLRSVVKLGEPQLRQISTAVTDVASDRIQTLIDDMLLTVHDANGVGLAAPQVGVSERLIVVASRPNLRYPDAPLMPPTPMLNPEIVAHGEARVKGWEGCLSVPDTRGLVPRYQTIEVAYLDREGRSRQQVFTDFVARIIQHEMDHLDGLVFLDRVEAEHDLISEAEFMQQYATQTSH